MAGIGGGLACNGLALQIPVVDVHMGVGFTGLRKAQTRTGHALVVVQFLALYIAQRSVRKDQLLCCQR